MNRISSTNYLKIVLSERVLVSYPSPWSTVRVQKTEISVIRKGLH